MSPMVIFQTPDGNPGYNQFEEIDEAVRFVETLRNDQGVENARMFALEEVKFEFRQYFRVEVDPPMVGPAGSTSGAAFVPTVAPAPAPTPPAGETFDAPFESTPFEAPSADSSPIGSVPPAPATPFGSSDASPVGTGAPTFMAPPPPANAENSEPTRRGLFGR